LSARLIYAPNVSGVRTAAVSLVLDRDFLNGV